MAKNKMGNTQKMAFLNAMKANKQSSDSVVEYDGQSTEYKTRTERHQAKQSISTKRRTVTLDDLYETLAEVQDYKSKDFTSETWLPFVNAFTQALEVYQANHPNQDDIVIAKEALTVAKNQLVRK